MSPPQCSLSGFLCRIFPVECSFQQPNLHFLFKGNKHRKFTLDTCKTEWNTQRECFGNKNLGRVHLCTDFKNKLIGFKNPPRFWGISSREQ